jgi:hypothetical protein
MSHWPVARSIFRHRGVIDRMFLPETFISKKFEKGVYYNPYLMRTIISSFRMASGPFKGLKGLVFGRNLAAAQKIMFAEVEGSGQ